MKALILSVLFGLTLVNTDVSFAAGGKKPAGMTEAASDIAYLYVTPGPAAASVNGHASLLVGGTVYNPNMNDSDNSTVYKIQSWGEFQAHYAKQGRAVHRYYLKEVPGAKAAILAAVSSVKAWYLSHTWSKTGTNCVTATAKLLQAGYPGVSSGGMTKPLSYGNGLDRAGLVARIN